MLHLRTNSNCPKCATSLLPDPIKALMDDHIIQSLVDKVFPRDGSGSSFVAAAAQSPTSASGANILLLFFFLHFQLYKNHNFMTE